MHNAQLCPRYTIHIGISAFPIDSFTNMKDNDIGPPNKCLVLLRYYSKPGSD